MHHARIEPQSQQRHSSAKANCATKALLAVGINHLIYLISVQQPVLSQMRKPVAFCCHVTLCFPPPPRFPSPNRCFPPTTPDFHTMPPKRQAKNATTNTPAPPSPKAATKIQKHGPSNADKNVAKPTTKKVKKGKNAPADDDEDAGNEKGGMAKVVRKARAKKTRRVPPLFIPPHPLMVPAPQ